jgi:hypothetical protein
VTHPLFEKDACGNPNHVFDSGCFNLITFVHAFEKHQTMTCITKVEEE